MKQTFLKLKVIITKRNFNKAKKEAVKNFNLQLQEILDFRDVLAGLKIQDLYSKYSIFPTDFEQQMAIKVKSFNEYITAYEKENSFFADLVMMDYEECGVRALLEKIEDKKFISRYL